MKLTVIIPTYNEERTIEELIRAVESVPYPIEHEVIVVDDASSDGTYEKGKVLELENRENRIKILKNVANQGKGFSIRRGLAVSTGDIVVIQDADDEYNPQDIPRLLAPILAGEAEVVYGSRFLTRRYPQGMHLLNWLANKFLTWMTNVLYGLHLTDLYTCYKLFKADLLKSLPLKENRFTFCPEATALLARRKIRIQELPIRYLGRTFKEGKKIKAKDFFFSVWTLLKYKFS